MKVITVVGCGFVGSIFLDEILKRMFAGKLPYNIRLIDFDTVDERNSANQNFLLSDAGTFKAEILAERVMRSGKLAEVVTERLTQDNCEELLANSVLVFDGVDNLLTRQVLWGYGMTSGTPVIHTGIAIDGTGKVEWTHPSHDTFSLAPQHTFGKTIAEPESGVTPPCELARMRGAGLNVSFAAAMAASIFLGFDPESHLHGEPSKGWLTEWLATPSSHFPVPQLWGQVDA